MKKWKGTVVVTFYQDVTVEAATIEEAKQLMCEAFNPDKADCDACEAYDVEEVSTEGETE
jgi:hypothetical protein